jgi:hypothetical protein
MIQATNKFFVSKAEISGERVKMHATGCIPEWNNSIERL